MKKAIVTGVTGQVGSYMADFLLKFTNIKVYGWVWPFMDMNKCYHDIQIVCQRL